MSTTLCFTLIGRRVVRCGLLGQISDLLVSSHTYTHATRHSCWSLVHPSAKSRHIKSLKRWTIPWYSSYGSDFNYDFHVTLDNSVTPVVYNYQTQAEHRKKGTEYYFKDEQPIVLPGMSAVSCVTAIASSTLIQLYGRGGESVGGAYYFLDLTALGRQEEWEEPKGRVTTAHNAVP